MSCLAFVDASSVAADPYGLATVTLVGRHEFDAAVAVLMVVPVDERRHPLTGLVFGGKWLTGVISSILSAPRDSVYTVLNSDSV